MKKTMTIILLSVAVIALGGWIVWQQQTIEKAEKTRQQESKTSDLKFKQLTSDQTDMKHKNDEQKK
ncbi:hypothetical protein [Bacillus pumilus]|nr:hypothetical protein [Bacillus pumilus]